MIAAAAIVYCMISLKYRNTFLPNTRIGGITVSGMTIEEVQSEIRKGIERYELVLEERDGAEERINGEAVGLHPVFDGTLENILRKQNSLLWGLRAIRGAEYPSSYMVEYDKGKMDLAVAALECLDPEQVVEPADAYVAFVSGIGLQIIKEEPGKAPVRERLSEEIGKAVSSLETRISLDERAVYKEPGVSETDPELLAQKEALKVCADVTVTYRFGSRSEVLDGSTILPWLSMDGEGRAVVDRNGVEAYVVNLAKKYNTAYCAKELKTSYGPTVTITKGHYGWLIDKEAETEALLEIIRSGESQEREPVYAQKAASHDGPDYGDTYVEMNLTAQHLFYYKNGKLLIESDFVSGNEAKGWSTPAGAYELTYKQRNAVLKGKNYNTPVTYWMPFNGNIGMHDGYWRSSFGGTIYKKNGSHGCINLPPAVAKTIYENIEAHIPVLCYHLDGTETGKTTPGAGGTAEFYPAAGCGASIHRLVFDRNHDSCNVFVNGIDGHLVYPCFVGVSEKREAVLLRIIQDFRISLRKPVPASRTVGAQIAAARFFMDFIYRSCVGNLHKQAVILVELGMEQVGDGDQGAVSGIVETLKMVLFHGFNHLFNLILHGQGLVGGNDVQILLFTFDNVDPGQIGVQ